MLPALTVAEPFALGHARRYPLGDLLAHVSAGRVSGVLASIDPHDREILLQDGTTVAFDAPILAVGARPVAAVENASTWRPQDSPEAFGGLLRDLEEGYVKRVAFVIPPGPVWPLPAYELALMTSREVWSMGINDAQITVITPEAIPLARFGSAAATTARVNRDHDLKIVLQPTVDELQVDRVIALPGLQGPRIPGSTQDEDGFIPVNYVSRMRDSTDIWAAGTPSPTRSSSAASRPNRPT